MMRNHVELMDQPVVSVNMLFGDEERWRRYALDRFEETKKQEIPLEMIVVINTDFSQEGINCLENQIQTAPFPVKVFFHEVNNIPRARNLAAEHTSTPYCFIWDDDDSITPRTILSLVRNIERTPLGAMGIVMFTDDGKIFHPQPEEMMPQRLIAERILVTGMQHTPFIVHAPFLRRFPLSEVRTLRGEWIEWSTRLWRAGFPCCHLIHDDFYVIEKSALGRSATRYPANLVHTLISLFCLAVEYDFDPNSFSGQLLYRRYFHRYLKQKLPTGILADLWERVVDGTRRLRDQPYTEMNLCVFDLPNEVHEAFVMALRHVQESRVALLGFRRDNILPDTVYDVPPFGIFDPSVEILLEECLAKILKITPAP